MIFAKHAGSGPAYLRMLGIIIRSAQFALRRSHSHTGLSSMDFRAGRGGAGRGGASSFTATWLGEISRHLSF